MEDKWRNARITIRYVELGHYAKAIGEDNNLTPSQVVQIARAECHDLGIRCAKGIGFIPIGLTPPV